jgi:hypothetical protein
MQNVYFKAGDYQSKLMSIKNLGATALLFALCAVPAWPQALIISQIVDGEVWQTTIVLTNTTSSPATASLSFFQETSGNATQPWNLPFLEVASTQSIPLAGGETLLIHTPGTAANLSVGWGQLIGSPGVVAYAVFTKRPQGLPAQIGTSEAIASASRILVPFDNTSGNVSSMALVNTSGAPQTINVKIQTTGGAISQSSLSNIPAQGHIAFTFPAEFTATAGQSGLAEFYTASGTIALLALNFNPAGSLSTAPAYPEAGPPIIGVTGSGAALFSSFGPVEMYFLPGGFNAGTVLLELTPNADNSTYSAKLNGGATFTNGIFSANGLSFSASVLQPNATVPPYGYFLAPDSTRYVVSSGSLTFNLGATVTSSNVQMGNITGTLSVTGTPYGGGAQVTLSGPISGPYFATVGH